MEVVEAKKDCLHAQDKAKAHDRGTGGTKRERKSHGTVSTNSHSSRGSLSQKADASSRGTSSAARETQAAMELSNF